MSSLLALLASGGGSQPPVDPPTDPPTGPVYAPTGSLDQWKAARAASATSLAEVLYFGDSTGFGQVPTGGPTSPLPYLLRQHSMAAGYADGGVGIYGVPGDATAPTPLDHAGVTANTVPTRTVYDNEDLMRTHTWQGAGVGDSITFQGRGTAARIYVTVAGSLAPEYTYEIDGGAPVQAPTPTTQERHRVTYLTFAEGLHTIKVTRVSGDVRVIVDWVRPAGGIVWHRAAVPSITSDFATYGQGWVLNSHLGMGRDGVPFTDHPVHRRVKLALWALGINDQQTLRPVAEFKSKASTFVTKSRTVGADPVLLVNHFEGAGNAQEAPAFRQALYDLAVERQCALVDIGSGGALGDPAGWVTAGYIANMGDPHLKPLGYQTQAAYLWDNLLKL